VAFDGPPDDRDAPDEAPVREIPPPREPDQPGLARAVGELAAENADLYRQVGDLTRELKADKARFGAWAETIASDRETAARDRNQLADRLDQALAMNEALAGRVTDLEHGLAGQAPAGGPGAAERRIDAPEGAERQGARKHLRRLKASNEVINVGAMGVGTGAAVLADVLGSAAAGDAAGIAGNTLGLVAAVIALARKRTEDKDGHRTQG
jgi:hypothetical protein